MRMKVWSLMTVAALALAGCNHSQDSSQPASPDKPADSSTAGQTANGNTVTGTVNLRDSSSPLSPAAKLQINLVDISAHDSAPLASKTVDPVASLPQTFELQFNPADVKASDLYVVQALLTDGDRHYSMPLQAPVLTKGNANQVSIQLVAEQTAGEKDMAAFADVQKQIGGMKVSAGTKLDKDISRGWQVFRQAGQVKFIRELVDYGDKGFTSTDYAYRDGKPWVAVQQKKASKDGRPSSTDRVSWDTDGNTEMKQHDAGGKVSDLGADAASDLQKQAQSILVLATGGKNK